MSFKQAPKAFEEMLLNSRIDDLARQVSDLQNKVSHWESRAEHAECYLAKSEQFCEHLTADNARLRELLREWIKVTCDYANLELVVVDSGLIERSKAAIGEGE